MKIAQSLDSQLNLELYQESPERRYINTFVPSQLTVPLKDRRMIGGVI